MAQRLKDYSKDKAGWMLSKFKNRINAYPVGQCPLETQLSLLHLSACSTCGKCVPCRDGLLQLEKMLKSILDGVAKKEVLDEMKALATIIKDTADCAIGYEAAADVLQGLDSFKDEYESHITLNHCKDDNRQKVPCIAFCPANVNVPAYISLIGEEKYADAVNVIRMDNPFPTACAMVCEHPCELRCRRQLFDASLNIRALKRFAVDNAAADTVKVFEKNVDTGKKVAIVGAGPSGLSAAYFLALMGHEIVVYEEKEKAGGMLRYGIPNYRFPKERLDEDIRAILSVGNIEIKYNVTIGKDITIEELDKNYDAVYFAIGAQTGKKLKMDGADGENVLSAVELLDEVGHGKYRDFKGKTVCVIGGGNVAMDASRTALRLGAENVNIVYRRRKEDMTALMEEIESAVAEGIELFTLEAPDHIVLDEAGKCKALVTRPQMSGSYDRGRPSPVDANKPPITHETDIVLIAVGQDIVIKPFEDAGFETKRNCFVTNPYGACLDKEKFFAGGDCVTGPATVIKAIAAGKNAATNIDEFLGYHHKIDAHIDIPQATFNNKTQTGRAVPILRPASQRKHDFEHDEYGLSYEEAMQEAGRCLRCDHFGCGNMEGGCV
ncbi:NADPH-dependent glutamate synthase beta chain [Acetitomaculum ruminis DSM 5522]|uniref:NADPH-dependent glutamate synthase beta chain n=1 Tax=Acetitomaculum ruminis DSM 5522 TaxID=1120918 RepID=A0A1I0YAY1_9FIRM|nr:NAD(P)-binding protein [Acetitomaculum ruminis]SFB10431.1 NADPH-dependent glutamate synthase beta chain [Acetitomaculum ruminis DSM 5522]